jgi:hypothetical protein
MSFCGTIRLEKRMKMRGFAMRCSSLAGQLLELKYKRGYDKTEAGDQLRLFQLTNDERDALTKFSKNLRWFVDEHKEHGEEYWKAYRELDYVDYEFWKLFDSMKKEDTAAAADILDRAGREEQLTDEEIKTAQSFLHRLSSRADSRADYDDGGCF